MPVPPTTIISHCQFPPRRYLIVRSCFQTISSATWSDTSLPEIDFLTGSWDHWWKWDKMVFRLNAYCVQIVSFLFHLRSGSHILLTFSQSSWLDWDSYYGIRKWDVEMTPRSILPKQTQLDGANKNSWEKKRSSRVPGPSQTIWCKNLYFVRCTQCRIVCTHPCFVIALHCRGYKAWRMTKPSKGVFGS